MSQQSAPKQIASATWIGAQGLQDTDLALSHYVSLPANTKADERLPAVIMVHGWGGDESVMWIFSRLVPEGTAIITPRAPINIEGNGAIWFQHNKSKGQPNWDSTANGVNALKSFVQKLPQHYHIDPKRIILVGFSQGAIVCNALVITTPKIAIGVASLAGTISDLPQKALAASHLTNFPVFIAHGKQDNTIPIEGARHARDVYQQLGADLFYQEYPVGHKVNSQAIKDLKAWLNKTVNRHNT